jgi:hypothetical protein
MNPLDSKFRRNRFSGYSARLGTNALATSNWGKKNPNGIPVPKLGLVWNSLINGLRLIEGIADEITGIESESDDNEIKLDLIRKIRSSNNGYLFSVPTQVLINGDVYGDKRFLITKGVSGNKVALA